MLLDPQQIKLVFSNLADNSIYFIKENGKITVTTKIIKDTLLIEWIDTGPGIPKEALNKIFEIAYTTRIDGFGLGLFHTKAIVEEYGGNISVDSRHQNGTKFIIKLPIIGKDKGR
jgi:signal transduction histidine kinase